MCDNLERLGVISLITLEIGENSLWVRKRVSSVEKPSVGIQLLKKTGQLRERNPILVFNVEVTSITLHLLGTCVSTVQRLMCKFTDWQGSPDLTLYSS